MAVKASTLRIGTRYRANRLNGTYDAIVIGSGMGGLTTAALLSRLGKKVLVLEQHYTTGGFTHSYEREGYEWDVGVHYIGDMGARTVARRLMDFVTRGELQWAPMDAAYDRYFLGEKSYDAMTGKQAYKDYLLERFPQEATAIDRYLALTKKVSDAFPTLAIQRFLRPWQQKLLSPIFGKLFPKHLNRTTLEVLLELTSNRELIAVWTGLWGDYGLPPEQSSFVMHALVARHYLNGGYYPVGGSWRISETILPRIQATGGEVFTYARVQEIVVEQGKTTGVRMEDGTFIPCSCVISSAGVLNTFKHLLPESVSRATGYLDRLNQVTPSIGHVGGYIGLQGTAAELGLPKTNFWIYPSSDYQTDLNRFLADPSAPFPVVYISFPSAKDPDFERRHPNKSTIEIVAPAPYAWFEPWANQTWGKRGADYDALKAQYAERLMEVLYSKLPQLRGKVDYYEFSTPLSTQYFNAYSRGELYGMNHDPKRFEQTWLTPKTSIKGLYLTGQDVLSCGVVGAMMSGVITAISVAGLPKMLPVLKQIFVDDQAVP